MSRAAAAVRPGRGKRRKQNDSDKAHSGSVAGRNRQRARIVRPRSVTEPVEVLGRIGYLSEQPDLPGWMRVDELLRYTKAFFPKWDSAYAQELLAQFGLNPLQRLNTLSKDRYAKRDCSWRRRIGQIFCSSMNPVRDSIHSCAATFLKLSSAPWPMKAHRFLFVSSARRN